MKNLKLKIPVIDWYTTWEKYYKYRIADVVTDLIELGKMYEDYKKRIANRMANIYILLPKMKATFTSRNLVFTIRGLNRHLFRIRKDFRYIIKTSNIFENKDIIYHKYNKIFRLINKIWFPYYYIERIEMQVFSSNPNINEKWIDLVNVFVADEAIKNLRKTLFLFQNTNVYDLILNTISLIKNDIQQLSKVSPYKLGQKLTDAQIYTIAEQIENIPVKEIEEKFSVYEEVFELLFRLLGSISIFYILDLSELIIDVFKSYYLGYIVGATRSFWFE